MASLVAALAALVASWLLVRTIIRLLFSGSVERASQWVWPKRPTRTDVAMSELGEEVSWGFGRVALIVVLVPICFGLTFLVVQGVLPAIFSVRNQRCRPASLRPQAPNPSIERTSSSRLRLLPAAAHVER
jgi:hypothetical protein